MEFFKAENQIHITNKNDFSIDHILECGQLFRYQKTKNGYTLVSKNKFCELNYFSSGDIIISDDIEYFENYFDLHKDYGVIKEKLKKHSFMQAPINFGYGIRILNQDPEETLISFIISANNNIPRIKNIIENICKSKGNNYGTYYSFPTCHELRDANETSFRNAGAGYRSKYLVETIKAINDGFDLNSLEHLETEAARERLMKLKGVGRKVADCILLFAFKKTDVFPSDTWIKKVYADIYGEQDKSAKQISQAFQTKFSQLSGYAQQYLFYYKKEYLKNKNGGFFYE